MAANTRRRTSTTSARTSSARRPGLRLEEVGVLRRHDGAPDPEPLEPERVDETTGGIARRVGEHRARVRASGLVLTAPADDVGERGLAHVHAPRADPEGGAGDDLGGPDAGAPVAEPEVGHGASVGRGTGPGEVDDVGRGEDVGRLAPVAARVHAHRTADTPGDAHEEVQPGLAGARAPTGEDRERHRGRRPEPVPVPASRSTVSNSPPSTSPGPGTRRRRRAGWNPGR